MKNRKLYQTIADIAYLAGQKNIYSGDSRADISAFILWAECNHPQKSDSLKVG